MNGINPLDWNGLAFLLLYAFLFVCALAASGVIASRLRPTGTPAHVENEDELALLAGGRNRLAETVVARLLARGALTYDSSRKLRRTGRGGGASALEARVLSLDSPTKWKEVRAVTDIASGDIAARLVQREVLMESEEARSVGLRAALPLIALFGLGVAKLVVGIPRDELVDFLPVFLAITATVVLVRWFGSSRLTYSGMAALRDAKARLSRLRMAPTEAETGMAVALFGVGVLAGLPYAGFTKSRESSGSGCGTSGCGGGGCGGGGCGGCGG